MPGANPYTLAGIRQNLLSRMLPLYDYQRQVYRMGEANPPSGHMEDYSPSWEVANFVIGAQGQDQAQINLQRNFTLLALTSSASSLANGGFKVGLYDAQKNVRLSLRGLNRSEFGGNAGGAIFLRDPYTFIGENATVLVTVQNLELVQNTIQIALYGQVMRFNQ